MITAVDIGATKTLIAQFGADGKPKNHVKFATPQDKKDFFKELVRHLQEFDDITVLSVGVPGVMEDGRVNSVTNVIWVDWPLQQMLHDMFKVPVYIENDAQMAALGEINAMRPLPHRGLYLTVSTGLAGGIVVDGKLPRPLAPGEYGQMVFMHEGKMQTWEHLASGKNIFRHFGKPASELKSASDWKWIAERLSLGLLILIPEFEPDVVVFGGGVGRYFEHFKKPLEAILDKRPIYATNKVTLHAARHPEEAVIYGCYHYARHSTAR
jgi:predicted NBD/HSP70 family sugar kinase